MLGVPRRAFHPWQPRWIGQQPRFQLDSNCTMCTSVCCYLAWHSSKATFVIKHIGKLDQNWTLQCCNLLFNCQGDTHCNEGQSVVHWRIVLSSITKLQSKLVYFAGVRLQLRFQLDLTPGSTRCNSFSCIPPLLFNCICDNAIVVAGDRVDPV